MSRLHEAVDADVHLHLLLREGNEVHDGLEDEHVLLFHLLHLQLEAGGKAAGVLELWIEHNDASVDVDFQTALLIQKFRINTSSSDFFFLSKYKVETFLI